jgi:hypothetical protein
VDAQRFRAQRVAIDHRAPRCTGLRAFGKPGLAALVLCLPLLLAPPARAQDDGAGGSQIYRYVNTKGRVVYTNAAEQVPVAQRESARVDLSHVSLNTQVGAEIERRLEEQHAALTQSTYCKRMVAAANGSFLERAWQEDAPSIVCAAAVLLLFFFTPRALRSISAPDWAKLLMHAIPALAFVGLIAFMVTHANKTVEEVKARAQPCLHETFARLEGEKDALMQRSQLVERLQQQASAVERAGKDHWATIRGMLDQ